MRRLDDHFRASLPDLASQRPVTAPNETISDRITSVPAEFDGVRPPLRRGLFRGVPVWYHAVESQGAQYPASRQGTPGTSDSRSTDAAAPHQRLHATPGPRRTSALFSALTDDGELFVADDAIACLQFEHYVASDGQRLTSLYYALKPLLPRGVQLELQRSNAHRRLAAAEFPRWPQDGTLDELLAALLAQQMEVAGADSVPFVGFWPHGKRWAWCLTHDVDTAVGYDNLEPLAQAEESRNLRSAWFFVPERYRVERGRLDDMRQRGHEVGVHGLQHSGKLFSSRQEFEKRRDRINDYIREWGVVGFRSASTYRNPFWLPELDADYDTSFMDNATLEPQRGGICSVFPFMLSERMVELPITLPMDHTLINVLRQDVVEACTTKIDWVRSHHGLALSLFHPDYNTTRDRAARYGAVLDALRADNTGWYALPHEVAAWWQRRRRSAVVRTAHGLRVEGPAAAEASVWQASLDGRRVRIEPVAM